MTTFIYTTCLLALYKFSMLLISLLCFPETGIPTHFPSVQLNPLCALFCNLKVNEIDLLASKCNLEIGGAVCFKFLKCVIKPINHTGSIHRLSLY